MLNVRRSNRPSARPVLAVTNTGGHLSELQNLLPRMLAPGYRVEWVTDDTPQSQSLLDGQRVHWVRPVYPRDRRAVLANLWPALRLLAGRRYGAVVSTGAGIALAFLPVARLCGVSAHYVESFTRLDGPSVTGDLLARVPGLRLYTQHESWADERWAYRGSVFDAFVGSERDIERPVRRVVVTLGMNPYGFRSLLERLVAILPRNVDVLWQTGATDATGLPIQPRALLPADELASAMRTADVVVAHAGVGSALAALDAGKVPVLVPRLQSSGEQIDDHQELIAGVLERRGLAIAASTQVLDAAMLREAASRRVIRIGRPARFDLS